MFQTRRIQLETYPVLLIKNLSELLSEIKLDTFSKCILLMDENTYTYCYPVWVEQTGLNHLPKILITSGESQKNLSSCQKIWTRLFELGADRHSLLLNIGGGVLGDMGGFCASTFMRGMSFVQIPTTLLSQVDASIGGKLGVNFSGLKNSIGLFKDPEAVVIYPEFLKTLSDREWRSGFAEIIKHALIANKDQWEQLLKIDDVRQLPLEEVLLESLKIKKSVVEMDPHEKGWRKVLNFGHTIGHALESWSQSTSQPLLHGEAVAIGMICEAYLSFSAGKLSISELEEISNYIFTIFGKYDLQALRFEGLLSVMKKDKKNRAGDLKITLLEKIGVPIIDQSCTTEQLKASIEYYCTF